MPAADAGAAAARLLADPHPAVKARRGRLAFGRDGPTAGLARPIGLVGRDRPVPSQAGADAWASDRTGGLIERFPVDVDRLTALVLASAVACDITWRNPLPIISAAQLRPAGRTRLRRRVAAAKRRVEQLPGHRRHRLGPVGVHALTSAGDDMVVVSVVAAGIRPRRRGAPGGAPDRRRAGPRRTTAAAIAVRPTPRARSRVDDHRAPLIDPIGRAALHRHPAGLVGRLRHPARRHRRVPRSGRGAHRLAATGSGRLRRTGQAVGDGPVHPYRFPGRGRHRHRDHDGGRPRPRIPDPHGRTRVHPAARGRRGRPRGAAARTGRGCHCSRPGSRTADEAG